MTLPLVLVFEHPPYPIRIRKTTKIINRKGFWRLYIFSIRVLVLLVLYIFPNTILLYC